VLVAVFVPVKNISYIHNPKVQEYFLRQYIHARESYNIATMHSNYYTIVKLLSQESIFKTFMTYINPEKNPESPLNLGKRKTKEINITSILYPSSNDQGIRAVVRYTTTVKENKKTIEQENLKTSLTFLFEKLEMNDNQRAVNPLGFRVTSYTTTPDDFATEPEETLDQ